jgi:hypothetical protein
MRWYRRLKFKINVVRLALAAFKKATDCDFKAAGISYSGITKAKGLFVSVLVLDFGDDFEKQIDFPHSMMSGRMQPHVHVSFSFINDDGNLERYT